MHIKRLARISLLFFIYVICAICGFKCLFTSIKVTSLNLFADDIKPNPVWEINTTDTSLARTALKIAKESYPTIDIEYYLEKIENIIENIKTSLREETEPEQILKIMNMVLFNELQFKYVQTGELEHISLNKVLDTKIGNCVGLTILYLSIAEGLHLPVYGVSVPEHIFARYDDGDFRRNIETGYEGMFTPDSYYINMHGRRISQASVKNGYYLKNLTVSEVIADIYLNRSIIQKEKGSIEAALKDVNYAIELHGNDAVAYCNRGVIYEKMKNTERAISDYNKAIELNPDYAAAYASRGLTYAESGEPEKALEDFNKALELDPGNTEIYMKRGILHADAQRFDDAIKDATTFIEFSPNNAFAYYIRAKAYRGKGDMQKCIEDYNKVIELSPRLAGVYYERGQIKNLLERTDEALEDFNTSIELFPYNPFAYLHRGNTFKKLGKNENALKDYLTYLKLNPNAPDAKEIKREIEDMQNKR